MIDMSKPTSRPARDEVFAYFWQQIRHVPTDGGSVLVEFEQRDNEEWWGKRIVRTEEGGSTEMFIISRLGEGEGRSTDTAEVWQLDWRRTARDCDGSYSSSGYVNFEEGKAPIMWHSANRDHAAERAGY